MMNLDLINLNMICYLCKSEKNVDEFILRRDGLRYKMCKVCNEEVQKKKLVNKGKRLRHTDNSRTCYKCMRFLPVTNFTRRATGTYFSACKECNKYEFSHTRRARLHEAGGKFTQKEFNELLKKYDACPMCKRKWSEIPLPKHKKVPWTADHIIPINPLPNQKQGTNDISNIQPLCFSCNSKKGNRN